MFFFFFKEKFNLRNIFRNYLWKKKKEPNFFFYLFIVFYISHNNFLEKKLIDYNKKKIQHLPML